MKVFKIRIGQTGTRQKSSVMDIKFIDEVVKAHNDYRSNHQVSPLSYSRELSVVAQQWADHLATTNTFQHSNNRHGGQSLGENIAMKWSSRADAYTGQEVTDQWYSEIKMYKFGGEPRTLSSGHFTQVVWKGSRDIGVGKSVTRDGKIIVVANYLPAGNMFGEYTYNVSPPRDDNISIPQSKPQEQTKPTAYSGDRSFSNTNIRSPGSDNVFDDFDDMRKNFFGKTGDTKPSTSISTRGIQSRGELRTTRTFTVTEGHGANKVTKVIVEETITKPNGEVITNRKETVTNDDRSNNGNCSAFNRKPFDMVGIDGFKRINISDNDKYRRREPTSSSSPMGFNARDSDSCPESHRAPPKTMTEFIDGCLQSHNKVRAKHGVPPLRHNPELSSYAQKWAEHLAANDSFQHSSCSFRGERVGENIACKWSSGGGDYTSPEVLDQWYSEISKHDYNAERSMGTGHFTQVVWKSTKELGMGKSRAPGGKIIVVASYRPAGNVVGTFRENVFPPS